LEKLVMNEIRRTGPVLILIAGLLFSGCSADLPKSDTIIVPAASPTATPSPLTGFDRDLQFIRTGGFTYIWVFSRKDGKPLNKEDSAFLRTNAPQVIDWVTTDEGRKVIAGTNFNLEEGNLEALKKRFVAEDYTGK
jgi:hypothetical protein